MNRLLLAYHPQILAHDAGPDHPERAKRVTAILDAVAEAQWRDAVEIVTAREALPEEISLVHDSRYVNAMRRLCDAGGAYLTEMEANVGSDSYPAALYSVGCGLTLAERIMAGDYKIGFAPTRPPGHHSVLNRPRGFCIFNNIAVLARFLQRNFELARIAVFDFDVHHGNGTETVFWSDPTVLYCSIHRENHFPYNRGRILDRGEGAGAGFTLNIPLRQGSGDQAYVDAINRIALPRILEFKPDFLLVSAGFDGHIRDVVGGMRLTDDGFALIAEKVLEMARETAGGRIISLLEGGYDLRGLTGGVTHYLERLIEG